MFYDHNNYRDILTEEFEKRKAHNPNYSLRAFSRDLKTSPSRLSEILQGKQGLSAKKACEIAKILNFNVMETDFFSTLVESEHGRSQMAKKSAKLRLKKFGMQEQRRLSLELFEIISHWEYLAVAELMLLNGAKDSIKWVATRLKISEERAQECIDKLISTGLLKRETGRLQRIDDSLFMWPTEIPSASIKNYHKEIILKSLGALFTTQLHEREYNSLVVPIDAAQIGTAKKMIRDFTVELNKLLTGSRRRNRVYCFSTQLFPMDEIS